MLQTRTHKDYQLAWSRIKTPNGHRPLYHFRNHLKTYGAPNILFIGSSHMRRWGNFAQGRITPRQYKSLLRNSEFLGIRGAKWWSLHNNLEGCELPRDKKNQGNMWQTYQDSKFHPHFVVCLGGGNDTEDLDLFFKHHLATKTSQYDKRLFVRTTMTTWYNDLTPEIDQFFAKLQHQIPGCELKYIAIFE